MVYLINFVIFPLSVTKKTKPEEDLIAFLDRVSCILLQHINSFNWVSKLAFENQ